MYNLYCFQCISAKPEKFEEILAKKEPKILKLEETRMSYFCANRDLLLVNSLIKRLIKGPKINIFGPNVVVLAMSPHHLLPSYASMHAYVLSLL